jgi:hypothetical protein
VNTVTIDAIGCGSVSFGDSLAVDTGLILSILIDSLLRLVLVNDVCITMATGAKFGDIHTLDFSNKTMGPAHRRFRVVLIWIPYVTVHATETTVLMNV